MEQTVDIGDSKILFYIIKLKYPKYHPFWFVLYMYLIYFRISKRKLSFMLRPVPAKFIANHLKKQYFDDIQNTVIVNEDNVYRHDKVLLLYAEGSNFYRPVYILANKNCDKDNILLSETLFHNITANCEQISSFKLLEYKEKMVNFADELDISMVNSPYDISNSVMDAVLKRFFELPKIVKIGDVLEINIKYYAPDVFYKNSKINHIENVFFKVNKLKVKGEINYKPHFCAAGPTEVRQSPNVQSFLPKKLYKQSYFNSAEDCCILREVPLCPYGLQIHLENLEKSVKPFLTKKKLPFNPVFLLQGSNGSGREILLTALSHRLGMHFYKIYNSELCANVYAQNETKLKNAFFIGKMASPCIVCINNFENFGKNTEGQFDERIMGYFADELDTLYQNNPYPLLVFCCTNDKNIPTDLKKLFLESFDVIAPNDIQREKNLQWILEDEKLVANFDLREVANKTHGFYFEDLRALVYYAKRNFVKENGSGKQIILEEPHFSAAIDLMQLSYNESIGAPRVPKVQWSDVGGLTDVKDEIIRTVNLPLKHPELMKSGLKRSGILLFGPPGTGKTLIAKAVATECGLCFLSVKGPELLNMYVGQSEQNIRQVFERAREASPCIIFFDELDSLAPNRGLSGDSGGVMDRVVSQLLAEMDGLNESATIFIIGATNRPDLIDPALLRPGRFDKLLYVGPCTTLDSKIAVLKAQTRKFNLSKNVDLAELVKICPDNITGADFYGICSNAWGFAVKQLIRKINEGEFSPDHVTHNDVVVDFENFKEAIENAKPSVSSQDLLYFEKLQKELASG